MMDPVILIYLLVGALAGLSAGLFGVGGGLVIVPALIFCFTMLNFPATILTHLAIGTSLATIIVTSISAVYIHNKVTAIQWSVFWRLTPGIIVGVGVGGVLANYLSGMMLQILFGCFAIVVATQMGLNIKPKRSHHLPGTTPLISAGTMIGGASVLFGIGGGTLIVPYLHWCNVRMQQAVALSAACGLPIALVGAAIYVVTGWQHIGLPAGSTGFVYWPAFAGIVLTSIVSANVGARLAQHLSSVMLRRCFAGYLLVIGVQLVVSNLF